MIIVKHISGSHAYGTNVPSSDFDVRGVFVAKTRDLIVPFAKVNETVETSYNDGNISTNDCVLYELNKFMRLLLNCNPNILETLWIKESLILEKDNRNFYDMLRVNRNSFLSKKILSTYRGYSKSQFEKYMKDGSTKKAMHFIRLMRMAVEVVEEGKLNVYRDDRDYLIRIRKGEITYKEIYEEYQFLDASLKKAKNKTSLREEPDYKLANVIVEEIRWNMS